MHISFTPALGETVQVPVDPRPHTTTVDLHFSAALSARDYDDLSKDNVKMQVWSDIPVGGRHAGEWGELDFEVPKRSVHPPPSFSLLTAHHNKHHDEVQRNTLSLKFSILLEGQHARFSFTYRLLYPSGEIKWLGEFGNNGTLVLNKTTSRLVLGEGWSLKNDASSWNTRGRLVEDLEVARVAHFSDYTAWAVSEDSFLGPPKNSSLIFLVPHVRSRSMVFPKSFILSASPDTTISLTSHGIVTASGDGSLLFQTCDVGSDLEALVRKAMAHCAAVHSQLISCDTGHVTIASPPHTFPIKAAIIPVSPSHALKARVHVPRSALVSLFPENALIALFCPVNSSSLLLNLESADDTISFDLNAYGGQFAVSPAHTFNNGDGDWKLSIISLYHPSSGVGEVDGLPTPPPSPHLHPVAHIRPSASTPEPSILSLSDREAVDSEDSEDSDSDESVSPPEPAKPEAKPGGFLIACVRYIIAFFSTWLGGIFGRSPNPPVVDEQSPSQTVDERTPLLQETQSSGPSVTVTAAEAPPSPTPPTVESASAKNDPPPPAVSPPALFAEVHAGTISFVVRSPPPHSRAAIDQIAVELNGQQIEERSVQAIGDGVWLVELEGGKGGRVKIYI